MEVNVTTQHDNKSIRTKSDQFMEDKSEPNFEQVTNQELLPIQETSALTKQVSNMLPTCT